jgi:hypothetical protein
VDWEQLRNGGELEFKLTDRAGSSWGSKPENAPGATCPSAAR